MSNVGLNMPEIVHHKPDRTIRKTHPPNVVAAVTNQKDKPQNGIFMSLKNSISLVKW